jgi:ribosomal protein L11 methyltransferase
MNKWLQIHIALESDQAEETSNDLFEKLGALAVTINPAEDYPLFQYLPGQMPLWNKLVITALFAEHTDPRSILNKLTGCQLIHHEILEEKDWVHETQKNFPAKCFASQLWVIPSWDKDPYPDPKIYIDPGLAFGTGTHPTTSLCLAWLADNPTINKTVIDFGCGSGILSLAACTLGANTVYAIDHDEQAILATQQNCALNDRMNEKLIVGTDAILPHDFQADVVIANILAKPLLALYPILLKHTKNGGTLVLSGLLESDYLTILDCYQVGFRLTETQLDNDWLRLVFIKSLRGHPPQAFSVNELPSHSTSIR